LGLPSHREEHSAGLAGAPVPQDGCRDELALVVEVRDLRRWADYQLALDAWDAWDDVLPDAVEDAAHQRRPEPAGADAEKSAAPARDAQAQVVRLSDEQRSEYLVVAQAARDVAVELYTPDADQSAARSCAAPELQARAELVAPSDAM
jgi:hypothetical protein